MSKRIELFLAACFYYSGLVALARWWHTRSRPKLIILNYHCAMNGNLRSHLLYLRRHYRILHLEQALEELFEASNACVRSRDRRTPLVLTFDDGYRDMYSFTMALASELHIPMTIFLIPGYIESGNRFWWQEPDFLVHTTRVSETSIEGVTYHLDNADERHALIQVIDAHVRYATSVTEREEFLATVRKKLQVEPLANTAEQDMLPLTWTEVQALKSCGWFSFGAHTMYHPVLAYIADNAELQYEVGTSRAVLGKRLGKPVRTFAYPIGKNEHIGEQGLRAVQNAAYDWAVTTIDGFNSSQSNPHLLHRFTVDVDQPMLLIAAKVSGVWPFFTRLMRNVLKPFRLQQQSPSTYDTGYRSEKSVA